MGGINLEIALQIDSLMRRINYFVTTVSVLDTPGRHVGSLMGVGGIVGEAVALENWVVGIMEEGGRFTRPSHRGRRLYYYY